MARICKRAHDYTNGAVNRTLIDYISQNMFNRDLQSFVDGLELTDTHLK